MLCSLKNKRPDKALNNRLLAMAYALIALAVSIAVFFTYPEYYSHSIIFVVLFLILCIYLNIKIITAAEEAISYGGFANEIIKNKRNQTTI